MTTLFFRSRGIHIKTEKMDVQLDDYSKVAENK